YRWRRKREGDKPWTLEVYVQHFAELGPVEKLPLELIGQEYEARQCWGDRPNHSAYLARFAERAKELRQILTAIDRDLAAELAVRKDPQPMNLELQQPSQISAGPVPPLTSVAGVLDVARRCGLLQPGQIDELSHSTTSSEPRVLAKELLQRGWLTPFQVN